jgi:hypothetical protein
VTVQVKVLVAVSSDAVALPFPAPVTGGTSLALLRSALKLIGSARATPQSRNSPMIVATSDGG